MAVMIGEAAVAIRADASGTAQEIESEVGPAAEKAGKEAGDKLSEKMKLGIAGAAVAVAGGLSASLEQAALGDKLAAQLGASGPQAADLGKIAGNLYANNFGDNIGEVNDALRGVLQSGLLPEDATNDQIQSITGKVMNLSSTFDQDLGGTSIAVGQMIKTGLADNADQALDLLTRGFQQGDDKAGDLLDTMNEYGVQFQKLGVGGDMALGLINQGLKAGARDGDLVADSIKEFSIRAIDGSKTTAAGFEGIGLSADDMAEKIAKGGPGAEAALQQTLNGLKAVKDPAERSALAVDLFGTQAEDMGAALYALDPSTAVDTLGKVGGAADAMGNTLSDNASSKLTGFMRSAQQAFVDVIGGQVVPIVQDVVGWLVDHLGPALSDVGGFITDHVVPPLKDFGTWLGNNKPLVEGLAYVVGTVLVGALGVWGTRSVIEAAKSAGAWVSTAFASGTSAATQEKSAIQVVLGWVWMGAQALVQGIKIAAVWTAQVVASAASGAASFAMQVARVVGGWLVMAATSVAQGAIIAGVWLGQMIASAASAAISLGVTVAEVVGGWIVMAATSLAQAAIMAAAWFIALGPIGWIIAAVIGLVALIIANWDTVKGWTIAVFQAIWGFIQGVWDGIVGAITGALSWIWGVITSVFGAVWGFISGIFSGIWGFIVSVWDGITNTIKGALDWIWNTISGAFTKVRDFIGGVFSGIGDAVGAAWDAVGDAIKSAINWIIGLVNKFVIGGVNVLIDGINFVNPFDDIPHVPSIPLLHEGGVFDPGTEEGLAILRRGELVVTPEQRTATNDLLTRLLNTTPATTTMTSPPSTGVAITNHIVQQPGEDPGTLAARVTSGVVWNLNHGTRPVGVTP